MKLIIMYLLCSLWVSINAQSNLLIDTTVYNIDSVDQKCELKRGNGQLVKYLALNVRYPRTAADNGIQGEVIAEFIIEKDGSKSNLKIVKNLSIECDNEVLRICRIMPKWEPALKNNIPVRCKVTLPVKFSLSN